MSFLKRVGEGISISVVSFLFAFKHPALFLYPILYGLVMFPSMAVMLETVKKAGNLPVDVVAFLMQIVFVTIASIAFLGLIRGTIARLDGGSMKFWRAMAVDGRMLLAMFFVILIQYALGAFAPEVERVMRCMVTMDELRAGLSVFALAYFAWAFLTFYFFPVICFETKNFFDAVGHSVKHFFHSWLEVFFGVFMTGFLVSVVGAVFAFVLNMDKVAVHETMEQFIHQPFAALTGDTLLAIFILAAVIIMATGVGVLIPALYHYATHNRKNPFTTPVSRKRR